MEGEKKEIRFSIAPNILPKTPAPGILRNSASKYAVAVTLSAMALPKPSILAVALSMELSAESISNAVIKDTPIVSVASVAATLRSRILPSKPSIEAAP